MSPEAESGTQRSHYSEPTTVTPGVKLLASRTVREYIPVVLSRPICGTSPRQPQETNTKSTATATPFL